jgi:hypothetical protein
MAKKLKKDGTPAKPLFGGKRAPGFLKGYDANRHVLGPQSRIIKIHVRLSKLMAEDLATPADEEITKGLNLPPGSTHGQAVVRAAILAAESGDTSAMGFILNCVEGPRVKTRLNVTISAEEFNQAINAANSLAQLALNSGDLVDVE